MREEAAMLLESGVLAGMFAKYVWPVDVDNEVHEAKTTPPSIVHHGYRLGEDEFHSGARPLVGRRSGGQCGHEARAVGR
jgi:hypothetical protein